MGRVRLVFGGTLLVLGLLLAAGVWWAKDTPAFSVKESLPPEVLSGWETGETMGLLIYFCKEVEDAPVQTALLLASGEPAAVRVLLLPEDHPLHTKKGPGTLAAYYNWGGPLLCRDAVSALYGVQDLYYLRMDEERLETSLPAVSINGATLSPKTLTALLLAEETCGRTIKLLLQQVLCPSGVYRIDDYFAFLSAMDTDWNYGRFYADNRKLVSLCNLLPEIYLIDQSKSR